MNKNIFFLLLFPFIFSCSCSSDRQQDIQQKLESWDKSIYGQPETILDSLDNINIEELSSETFAYHSLLSSIAYERINGTIQNDSLISLSLAWYKESKDLYNLCRALLYKGIALYSHNHIDSSAYEPVKEAEELFNSEGFENDYLDGVINLYLGKIYRLRTEPELAILHLNKSLNIFTDLGNEQDIQKTRLELFWVYLSQKKYGEALSNIIIFEDSKTISPLVEYDLYMALSSYYTVKKEYNISIEYIKKMILLKERTDLKISEPKLYYSLALNFKRLNKLDSALYYSKLAANSIHDSLAKDNHFYYRYLADLYVALGDYKMAQEYYRKAYLSYVKVFSKISQNRVLEIEKKYDVSRREVEMSKLKVQSTFQLNIIISLVSFAILVLLFFRIRLKSQKMKVTNAEKQKFSAETELKKAWFLNELLKASAALLPHFVEDINKEAVRGRKISKEMTDNLNSSIDNIRTMSRNRITAITKSENFRMINPNLDYLSDLSDFEKIVLILIDFNYSVQEISELLNSSPSSIRSIKTKIKEKILAIKELPFDPVTTFLIFK